MGVRRGPQSHGLHVRRYFVEDPHPFSTEPPSPLRGHSPGFLEGGVCEWWCGIQIQKKQVSEGEVYQFPAVTQSLTFPHPLLPSGAEGGDTERRTSCAVAQGTLLPWRGASLSSPGRQWELWVIQIREIPALDLISFLSEPQFPHLSKRLSENWSEG